MKKTPLVIGTLIVMTGLAFAYNKALESAGSLSECIDMTDRIADGCYATCKNLGAKYGFKAQSLCDDQCFDDVLDNLDYCGKRFPK